MRRTKKFVKEKILKLRDSCNKKIKELSEHIDIMISEKEKIEQALKQSENNEEKEKYLQALEFFKSIDFFQAWLYTHTMSLERLDYYIKEKILLSYFL